MNQHQLDALFLVCLFWVSASTCFGRYSPIFRGLCTDAIWCNYVRSQHTSYTRNYTKQHLCRASWRFASKFRNMQRYWLQTNKLRKGYQLGVDLLINCDIVIFLDRSSKNTQLKKFMKISPVGAELFRVDRRKYMTKIKVAFSNPANCRERCKLNVAQSDCFFFTNRGHVN
jgi:hypothetical protein